MPILNYDSAEMMPDLDALQMCDVCGIVAVGTDMFFSFRAGAVAVICSLCHDDLPMCAGCEYNPCDDNNSDYCPMRR